ncbi:MAG TPA: GNAT family N-acetyltransferase [Candidatus Latescibacteria bacterium]|nr:GNAT family N-acetyltransferase [Candidatus Latescibacterota bacterium]
METLPETVDGPRGGTWYEFGEILDFLNFVFRSSVGRKPSIGGDYPHLYNERNVHNFRHIRVNGRVISNVSIYPARVQWGDAVLKIGGIGGVATDPDYRKHGFAGAILQHCIEYMEKELNCDLSILWTGIPDYYRRWGWEHAAQNWTFFIDRTTITYLPVAPTGEILTDTLDSRVIQAVESLHTTRRAGVVRDRELTEVLLNIRTRVRCAVLMNGDAPLAYIVYSPGEQIDVKDFGGDGAAVLGLLRVVFGLCGARTAQIHTPAQDKSVAPFLVERGFAIRASYAGMLAILKPQRILDTYGIKNITVESEGDGWRVQTEAASAFLTRRDLVKLLFGPERPPEITHPGLPLPFYYGQLDHM